MDCFFCEIRSRYRGIADKLDQIGRKTRKVIIMNKELYSRHDVHQSNVSRTGGGRGLIGCMICVKVEESSLV